MPVNNALTPEGQNALGAAFGYYPQLRRNRQFNDPVASSEMPLQFMRSRLATTMGTPSDILNMFRSPNPMEVYGDVNYAPQQQVPYGSQQLMQTLPLPPQGPAQQMAGNVGSFVPMSPMEALQAARLARQAALAGGKVAKKGARLVGEELNAAMMGERQGTMLGAITPSPMYAVPPSGKQSFQYPQQEAIRLAEERALTLGESANPMTRMLQQGYENDWYHGSTGDITKFRQDLLGEATGAASAKKGFFFARDPQNPPASMMVKSTDPESINFLKKLGKTDEEIASLNAVSMQGHGAETASGYAQIGGSREYREAMRKAKSAEKRQDWDEYEKQMQVAEDSEIGRMREAQSLVAKYGDARDTMTEKVNQTFYNLQHPQAQAELLDKKYKELMPYGWYNSYTNKQFDNLKSEISKLVGKDAALSAIKEIDKFKAIKNERALIDKTQEGGNVMPVALRYKNPLVHDFGGSAYREQTYSDLIDKALSGGHDALILKNTYDPGGGPAKLVDVGVVFSPDQIRSRFAAFDPLRKTAATATAAGLAAPDLLAAQQDPYSQNEMRKFMRQGR